MPLIKSGSKKAMSKNIETEMNAGKPQKQSIAIAYNMKRRAGKKKSPKDSDDSPKLMFKGGEVDLSAANERRPMPESEYADEHQDNRTSVKGQRGPSFDTEARAAAGPSQSRKATGPADDNWLNEGRHTINNANDSTEMDMEKESSTDPKHINKDHDLDIADARYANGGEINFHDESKADTENASTMREMNMEKESSTDPKHIDEHHSEDIEDALLMAAGGVVDSIMAKRKQAKENQMYADGGEVDLSRNADEDANFEDQQSFEALKKENYSETPGLDALDSPMDSNQHSPEHDPVDIHDESIVDAIRRKAKKNVK